MTTLASRRCGSSRALAVREHELAAARVVASRNVEVSTDESALMAMFRYEGCAELFAVRFSLDRMAQTAEHTVTEDGLVILQWGNPSGIR